MGERVLITGSTGFIGQQLCHKLQTEGFEILKTTRSQSETNTNTLLLDLTNPQYPAELCSGIDTIFHLAGKAHALSEVQQDDNEYQQINTAATRKLLVAAQQAGVKRFIYFSSVKAVGDSPEQIIDENFWEPAQTAYGRSKYAAEQLVLHGGYVQHPVVIRPCMVYGNTTKGNLPKMIKAIHAGYFPPLPEFNNLRSMVHVDDVVQAALLAAQKPQAAGQIYIVTDNHNYSSRQLYTELRKALGKKRSDWTIPLSLFKGLAKIGDLLGQLTRRRFIFDSDRLQKLSASARYSSAKISSELGYQPQHTLPQSLPEIIRYLNLI
jgi:nucleoside-diphosphate-sugar epimerase